MYKEILELITQLSKTHRESEKSTVEILKGLVDLISSQNKDIKNLRTRIEILEVQIKETSMEIN